MPSSLIWLAYPTERYVPARVVEFSDLAVDSMNFRRAERDAVRSIAWQHVNHGVSAALLSSRPDTPSDADASYVAMDLLVN